MVSSFTTNKSLEKPGNGDYVDTWNVPVNGDMDVIDQALGGTTFLNATGGSATLSVSQYRAMALSISGAMSGNVVYTIPSGVGGTWIVYNNTTDATGGPWTVTFASAGGGTSINVRRGFNTTIYSDGTNIRLADNSAVVGGSDTQVQFNLNNTFSGSNNFVYDYTNARVGIGTATPAGRLSVTNNGTNSVIVSDGNTTDLRIDTASSVSTLRNSYNAAIALSTNGSEAMRITGAQNVGIGVTPTYKLQVAPSGSSDQLAVFNESGTWTANGGVILADYYNATTMIGGIKISAASPTAGYLSFHTGGTTERMRITATGNVGIGETNPGERLVVSGNIRSQLSTSYVQAYSTSTGGNTSIINDGGAGYVDVNSTTTNTLYLRINNTAIISVAPTGIGVNGTCGISGSASVGGGLVVTGAASVGGSSVVTNNGGTYGINITGNALGNGIPSGGIIMWSGSVASIPSGWRLCDGGAGTPDLRNRFVVCAGGAYGVGATGGSADATLVAHTHTFAGTTGGGGAHSHSLNDPGHSHVTTFGYVTNQAGPGVNTDGPPAANVSQSISSSTTGISVNGVGDHVHGYSGTTSSAGSSGTNANLPPYYALCYIMKL